jgi:hypothetical protein
MSAVATHATSFFLPAFSTALDTHWETVTCFVWNQREHAGEERELVYEISWIPELLTWRRFLRSQRKVKS